jgi:hypothetical protein
MVAAKALNATMKDKQRVIAQNNTDEIFGATPPSREVSSLFFRSLSSYQNLKRRSDTCGANRKARIVANTTTTIVSRNQTTISKCG